MNNGPVQMFMLNPPESQPSSSAQRLIDKSRNTQVNLDNVSDFSNVCRTCATITEFVIPIFTGEGLQNNIADKIHKHLPIGVSESDVLPRVICYPCASALLAWHELVQCCVQADQAFRAKIAADTASNKDKKPTTQKALEEDSQSKLKHVGNYVLQHMAPPRYPMTYRRCDFCHTKHSDTTYKDHLVTAHSEQIFYCEECDQYVDKRDFVLHMSLHAVQYTSNHEMKEFKKVKKNKMKRESDVNRNINVDVPETPKSQPVSIAPTPKPVKSNEENEFSDHSDTEYGFGPLPESVFEAIEDSQDSQPTEATRENPGIDSENEESNKSEPPTEDSDTKNLRKRVRICPICSKVYQASSSYFYHMKYTHKQIKEHECQICAKKFATRTSLKIHAATHTRESQFECEQCKKRFRSNASLYIHEQTHIGVKSWSCDQCHRSFRWKTHLLRHMKRHSAEKAHVCTTCGRGFSIRCDLLRHARTHTAGQFDCDKCDVKFAQLRYLKVHMEKKHSAKVTKS